MKILLATSSVTPLAGIPSYNRELCSLLGKDNELHLLVDENINEYSGYKKVYTTAGITILKFVDFKKLCTVLNKEDYDVIINSNSHSMSICAPYINNRTRIITISHSLGTFDCDNAALNHKYVDRIVALSDNCRKYLKKRFRIKGDKISVIFNSVADKVDSIILREAKKQNTRLRIVFAGGTASSKSPDIVIPIIWELSKTNLEFDFYWLGITTPPLKTIQPYNDVRQILPNDERVFVKGLIPHNQAADIIANCNIFLAPSRREGFPMALLEAMRVGCIPIVSDYNIANKEVINDNVNGFIINHRDTKAFIDRIKDIICNHEYYKKIYEESYSTFKNELSFSIWHSKISDLLSDNSQSHKMRKSLNHFDFYFNVIHFQLLEKYNLIENHLKEVVPCAWRFYKFYRRYQNK